MSSKARLRRHGRGHFFREDGVALVEFALVLPFLLLIIFGMVDLGKAVSYWNDETHLVNQAARFAAVNKCTPCAGQTINNWIGTQAETNELKNGATFKFAFADASGKFPGQSGYVAPTTGIKNHCVGAAVRVTVSYPYNLPFVSKLNSFFHHPIGTINIRASSTMRIESAWAPTSGVYNAASDAYNDSYTSPASHSPDAC